jgi:hypothetical protein
MDPILRKRPALHDAHFASVVEHAPPETASPPTQVQALVAIDVLLTLYDPAGTGIQSLCPVASWYSLVSLQATIDPPAHLNPTLHTVH